MATNKGIADFVHREIPALTFPDSLGKFSTTK